MKVKTVLMMLFVGLMTMGFECVNDNAFFSVNLQGVTGTFKVNPGNNPNFNDCKTFLAQDYLDASFGTLGDVRIYDIRVSTIGAYGGNVNGRVEVNGVTILSYSGPWSNFSTPRSLVTSTLITRSPAGLATLINAIKNKQDITLCGIGSVSQIPVPDGLYVKVEVFGQVDGTP